MNTGTEVRPRGRRRILVAGLLGGVLASLILLLQVIPYGLSRSLTPIDEIGHVDYAIAMSVGHWPRWGDTYAQQTLLIADCVGSGFGPSGSCHPHERRATDYYPAGWSYEAQQPPLGYALHGVIARATGLSEPLLQLSWLRGASLLLSALGLIAIGALAGAIAPMARVAFAAATPAALIPEVVNAAQFVTNDSALLIAGAVAVGPGLLLLLRPDTRRWVAYPLAVAAGVVVPLIKPVASVTLLAMLLWAALVAYGARSRTTNAGLPALKVTTLQFAVAGATIVAFVFMQQALGSVPSRTVMDAVLSDSKAAAFPWESLAIGVREAVGVPFHAFEPVTEFRNAAAAAVIGLLLVALLLISVIPGPRSLRMLNIVPLALLGAVGATMIIWTVGLHLWGGFGLALPSRFLIPLVPLLALLWLKGLARMNWVTWGVPALGALLAVVMVWPIVPMWLGWE